MANIMKERIVAVAAPLFAEYGFRGVTVRALARRLGVHYSLINYHFRSKQALYREVVSRACAAPRYQDLAAEDQSDGDPLRRLVFAIETFLRDSLSKHGVSEGSGSKNSASSHRGGWQCCVIAQECLQSGSTLRKVIVPAIKPHYRLMTKLVADVRGVPARSLEAQFAAFCLFAQVDALVTYRPLLNELVPSLGRRADVIGWFAQQLAFAAGQPGRIRPRRQGSITKPRGSVRSKERASRKLQKLVMRSE